MNELISSLQKQAEQLSKEQLESVINYIKVMKAPTEKQTNEEEQTSNFFKKWREEAKALENIPMYQRNATMFMLGKQPFPVCEGQLLEDYNNIKSAHRDFIPYNGVYDFGRHMYQLGFIYGKRAERARRKGKKAN